MNQIKKLAGQTAIYGLSSILGRVLNYLLVPLYTREYLKTEYGVVIEMYAYVALLIIILTYGMETAYFRFAQTENDQKKVFSTAMGSLLLSSLIFLGLAIGFAGPVASLLDYPENKEYVVWFAMIVAFDAITSIPFAKLRQENKATAFATIKLINIAVYIGLNLLMILAAPYIFRSDLGMQGGLMDLRPGIGYIFIANLISSGVTLVLVLPVMAKMKLRVDWHLWKRMIGYALPLLVMGVAGSINETMDRPLLKYLLPGSLEERLAEVGVYGACYKISILISLFIQAFRYAAEPFFFSHAKTTNSRQTYADVMTYFSAVCGLIFVAIMVNMSAVKYFIGPRFHVGLQVVPILLIANIFLGFFYNLSVWYKLEEKTLYGARIAILGALITLVVNWYGIPRYGYMASAWATLACYATMAIVSYAEGRKYFPVPYELTKILGYIGLALGLYGVHLCLPENTNFLGHLANTFLIFVYILVVAFTNKSLRRYLPGKA